MPMMSVREVGMDMSQGFVAVTMIVPHSGRYPSLMSMLVMLVVLVLVLMLHGRVRM